MVFAESLGLVGLVDGEIVADAGLIDRLADDPVAARVRRLLGLLLTIEQIARVDKGLVGDLRIAELVQRTLGGPESPVGAGVCSTSIADRGAALRCLRDRRDGT